MSRSVKASIDIVVFPLEADDHKRGLLYQLLSDDEKRRAAGFRFDKHRNRFIVGRGTIREILAEIALCPPRIIRFDLNSYGKPALAKPASCRHIQFNASSSATLGAIAISNRIPLGFDIEKIKITGSRDYDLIVESQFTRDEYSWYQKHKESERVRLFFDFWTCKEAYLKALGIGLSGKLDSFSIDLQGREPSVSYTELEQEKQSMLSLYRLNVVEEFAGCLALPKKSTQINLSYR